jgi:hypothetical protein
MALHGSDAMLIVGSVREDSRLKDTPAYWLAMASALFIICPGVALLASDLHSPRRATGAGLLVVGAGSSLYWIERNYLAWRSEFAPRRRRGKVHKGAR